MTLKGTFVVAELNRVLALMMNIWHTHRRSCVITTSPCWQAACRAEPGSLSAKSDLEERARLGGPLMSSLVQWAKRSNSFGRLCSITARRRRPDSVISGLSPGVGGGSGATKSFCSYLALIHDSRSSLEKQNAEKKSEYSATGSGNQTSCQSSQQSVFTA